MNDRNTIVVVVVAEGFYHDSKRFTPTEQFLAEIVDEKIKLSSILTNGNFLVPLEYAQFFQSPLSFHMLTIQLLSPFFPAVFPDKCFITNSLRIGSTQIIHVMSFVWFTSDKYFTINIDGETKKIQERDIPPKTGFFFGGHAIEYDFRFLKPYIPFVATTEEVHACALTEEANDCAEYPSRKLLSGSAKSRGCLRCCIQ
jgi:hypothetical protein